VPKFASDFWKIEQAGLSGEMSDMNFRMLLLTVRRIGVGAFLRSGSG
jgi:hypothetical protein